MILPAYNVAGYIEKCLESVTTQDIPFSDYEIIIVNDGSTDNTPQIIDKYAKDYSNITVLHQKNQGLSVARNNGLNQAKGEYIWFIDSDDTICPNCIGKLLDAINKLNIDMLCVAPSIQFTDKFPLNFNTIDYLSPVVSIKDFINTGNAIRVAWGYITKRSIWTDNNIKFLSGIIYEDAECMSRLFYYIKNGVSGLNKFSVYNYVQREGSLMHKKLNWQEIQSFPKLINSINAFIKKIEPNDYFVPYYRETCTGAYINGIKQIIISGEEEHLNEYVAQVRKAGNVINMGTSLSKRIYRYFAIHFPRIFIKICQLVGNRHK